MPRARCSIFRVLAAGCGLDDAAGLKIVVRINPSPSIAMTRAPAVAEPASQHCANTENVCGAGLSLPRGGWARHYRVTKPIAMDKTARRAPTDACPGQRYPPDRARLAGAGGHRRRPAPATQAGEAGELRRRVPGPARTGRRSGSKCQLLGHLDEKSNYPHTEIRLQSLLDDGVEIAGGEPEPPRSLAQVQP